MARVKIKQIRSAIDRSMKQKRTLEALGLRKINATVEHEWNNNIKGMVFRVSHLVEVEKLNGGNDMSTAKKLKNNASAAPVVVVTVDSEEE